MNETAGKISDPRFSPRVTIQHVALDWRWQIAVFLLSALLVFSRRPDALLYPQFYGEDGLVWYLQAYTMGLFHPLVIPYAGYLQTLPRLAADLAVLFPLSFAPLLMNVVGIAFQVLPVTFLLSSRCSNWAPLPMRALMALAYVALPNSFELDVSVTNAQWHCALLAVLIVVAQVPATLRWRVFDLLALLISGLTGPFCILLFPFALIAWFLRRRTWMLANVGVIAACALVQSYFILHSGSADRAKIPLGATPKLFIDILAAHVFLEALGGMRDYVGTHSFAFLVCAAVLGCAVLTYAIAIARAEFKLFIAFCLLVFAASLANPKVSTSEPQWHILNLMNGARYWFLPMIAFVWSLIWCATDARNHSLLRWVAAFALLLMIRGVVRDWEYPAYPNQNFRAYARQFESAAKGATVTIPEYPVGWQLKLVK